MSQTSYALNSTRPGLPGLPVDGADCVYRSAIATGAVAQISTVTVDSAQNDTTYTLTVTYNGADYTASYTSDGTATTAEIAAGLDAAIDAEPNINAFIKTSNSSNVLTLTARYAGESFTFSVNESGDVTLATGTAAASAGSIPFGRGVVADASDTEGCALPDTANDTLKVVNATPTAENAGIYTLTVTADLNFDGHPEAYSATYTADGSASVEEIVDALQAALDAQMPANTIAITEDNTKVVFTSELPGLDFNVTATEIGSTATWTIATATDLVPLRFKGISRHSHRVETSTAGVTAYPGGGEVSLMQRGIIYVELDEGITPSLGDPVFCRASASGSEVLGAFRDAQDGADCFFLPPSVCEWAEAAAYNVSGKRIAALRVHKTEV